MCKYCEPDDFMNGNSPWASLNLADDGDTDTGEFFNACIVNSLNAKIRPHIAIDVCIDGTENHGYAIPIRFCPRCGRDLYAEYPRGVELPEALKV
jgi:hypothetical protein